MKINFQKKNKVPTGEKLCTIEYLFRWNQKYSRLHIEVYRNALLEESRWDIKNEESDQPESERNSGRKQLPET